MVFVPYQPRTKAFFVYSIEAQWRFGFCFLTFVFSLFCCSVEWSPLMSVITASFVSVTVPTVPYGQFIFTEVSEFWWTLWFLAIDVSLVLTFPFVCYQLWAFFRPSIFKSELAHFDAVFRRAIIGFVLALIGTHIVFLPACLSFCLNPSTSFASSLTFPAIHCQARVFSYILFVWTVFQTTFVFIQGILFLRIFIDLSIISDRIFRTSRFGFFLCLCIVAALLAPPDIVIQSLITFCFLGFFEWGLILSLQKKHRNAFAKRLP